MGRQPRITDLLPVDPHAVRQARMRDAAIGAIDECDMREIVAALKKKAKEGDLASARFLLEYAAGGQKPVAVYNVQVNCDAPPADLATEARPGTANKLEILRNRASNGHALFHDNDGTGDE